MPKRPLTRRLKKGTSHQVQEAHKTGIKNQFLTQVTHLHSHRVHQFGDHSGTEFIQLLPSDITSQSDSKVFACKVCFRRIEKSICVAIYN